MFYDWPEDSIQSLIDPWWIKKPKDTASSIERWDLLVALVPYLGEIPHRVQELTRATDREHTALNCRIDAFKIDTHYSEPDLPSAALPEPQFMFSGKVRPVLVVSHAHPIPNRKIRDSARWQTKPTYLVAPFYGVEADGSRGGWPQRFVDRIRQAAYPQYFWDHLPPGLPRLKPTACTSVLRLDQIFPINREPSTLVHAGWTLSEEARKVIKDWTQWHHENRAVDDGPVHKFRKYLAGE